MNKLNNFNFGEQKVRTTVLNNEPLFSLNDVCEVLELKNPRQVKMRLMQKGVHSMDTLTPGGKQKMLFINESNVYKLAFQSRKPQAEAFSEWVTSEVLPTIRKHGAYMTQETIEQVLLNPDTVIKLATELKEEREAKQREREGRLIAEQQVQELKPKADYCDTILQNPGLVTITQISKDYGMSGQKMNALLHELGVQYKQGTTWLLYAKHQAKGWTQSETSLITTKDGVQKTVFNTKWTQKGRLGLYELLKKHDVLPMIDRRD